MLHCRYKSIIISFCALLLSSCSPSINRVNNRSFQHVKPSESISTEWGKRQKDICPFGWKEHHYNVQAYKDGVRVETHDENGVAQTVRVYLFNKANQQSIAVFQQAIQSCGLHASTNKLLSQWNETFPQFKRKLLQAFSLRLTTDVNAFAQQTKNKIQQANLDYSTCMDKYTTVTNSLGNKQYIGVNIKSCESFIAKSEKFWFAQENKEKIPQVEKRLLMLQKVLSRKSHGSGSTALSNWSTRYLYSPLIKFTGDIKYAAILKVISEHTQTINDCYLQEQRKRRNIAGKLTVKFSILKDGSVGLARIRRSTLRNKKVETCLLKTFKALTFPKSPNNEATVAEYSFIFTPQE